MFYKIIKAPGDGNSKKEYFAKYDEEIEYERPGLDFTLFAYLKYSFSFFKI